MTAGAAVAGVSLVATCDVGSVVLWVADDDAGSMVSEPLDFSSVVAEETPEATGVGISMTGSRVKVVGGSAGLTRFSTAAVTGDGSDLVAVDSVEGAEVLPEVPAASVDVFV
ncbi:hypothetical protein [Mycobacterium sp. NPDC050441]|uniref:hypothetical protein n=1 Tax=Mycobacterium sp. NPDC050441 TaxID=3155403 RepID=UPI0033F442EF